MSTEQASGTPEAQTIAGDATPIATPAAWGEWREHHTGKYKEYFVGEKWQRLGDACAFESARLGKTIRTGMMYHRLHPPPGTAPTLWATARDKPSMREPKGAAVQVVLPASVTVPQPSAAQEAETLVMLPTPVQRDCPYCAAAKEPLRTVLNLLEDTASKRGDLIPWAITTWDTLYPSERKGALSEEEQQELAALEAEEAAEEERLTAIRQKKERLAARKQATMPPSAT